MKYLFCILLSGLLLGCMDSGGSNGSGESDTNSSVDLPTTIKQQYTLIYTGEDSGSLVSGSTYLVSINSDDSLTIGSKTLVEPSEKDLLKLGNSQVVWKDGDLDYVLSLYGDAFNEINVYDSSMPDQGVPAYIGQLAPGSGRTITYCSEDDPEGFNPAFYTRGTTFDASARPLFNRLVEFERGGTKVVPGLAESWTVSADGMTYTFNLRENVKFHQLAGFKPSRDFNADDVLFSINRQLNPTHPYHSISNGSYIYFDYMDMADTIASINKLDDYKVEFKLNQANASFLANLAMDFASIHSAEYAGVMMNAGTPEQLDTSPVGTGPFILAEYEQSNVIRYVSHTTYWEGNAPIDHLVFAITPDADNRYAELQAGNCDHVAYPNLANIQTMQNDADIEVLSKPGLNIGYLAFNTNKPPFTNPKVRQALNHATNKAAILKDIYKEAGQVAKNPIPPSMWSYSDEVVDYEYDPEKARQLLADAGFPDGFSTDIWAMPVQRPYNPDSALMAEMIQADWAAVGVTASIVALSGWSDYLSRTESGEHETMMLGWTGDNGDPDNFLNTLLSCQAAETGGNRAFWCDATFDNLVQNALNTSDTAERTALYEQAQLTFKQAAPWITLAHSVRYELSRLELTGYQMSAFGGHDFYGVSIKE